MFLSLKISTSRQGFYDIRDGLDELVTAQGIQSGAGNGICVAYTPDCDAAVVVTSSVDPLVHADIIDDFRRMVPSRADYGYGNHSSEGFDVAAAHTKSALLGCQATIPVKGGRVALGDSEGVYLVDFIGGKERAVYLKYI